MPQQAADQGIILRKVNEKTLNPGMNVQDGMLTTHSERAWLMPEAEFLREFLGDARDEIECPTETQKELFGPRRRRVPAMMDLKNPLLLGPVQNQEHYMNGVVARRNNWNAPILGYLEEAYKEFGDLPVVAMGFLMNISVRTQIRSSSVSVVQQRTSKRLVTTCALNATPRWAPFT